MRVRTDLGESILTQNEPIATVKANIPLSPSLVLDLPEPILDDLVRSAFPTYLWSLDLFDLALYFVGLLKCLYCQYVLALLVSISAQAIHEIRAFASPDICILKLLDIVPAIFRL